MSRGRSRRPNRIHRLLVALAALGLTIGVRPALNLRGHLVMTAASPAPVEDLAAAFDAESTPIEQDEGPTLSVREEDGTDEDADEAIDLAWSDLGLVARAGRPRWHASPSLTFPPEPARSARPGHSRSGHPPDPHAPSISLPIRLCRFTC